MADQQKEKGHSKAKELKASTKELQERVEKTTQCICETEQILKDLCCQRHNLEERLEDLQSKVEVKLTEEQREEEKVEKEEAKWEKLQEQEKCLMDVKRKLEVQIAAKGKKLKELKACVPQCH